MRILRQDLGVGTGALDLHPKLSVISTDNGRVKVALLETIRRLAAGNTKGVTGLIEHDGILIESASSVVENLGATAEPFDVAIYLGYLPDDDTLVQLELERARTKLEVAGVWVEELRGDLDFGSRAQLAQLVSKTVSETSDQTANHRRPEEELAELRKAYRNLAAIPQEVIVFPEGVEDLIQRVEAWEFSASELEQELLGEIKRLEQAEGFVAEASQDLARAIGDSRKSPLTEVEQTRLDDLVADEGRRSRSDKRELESLLEKVGVESETAYNIHRIHPKVSPESQKAVHKAEAELEAAERRLLIAQNELAKSPKLIESKAVESQLREDARSYLGVMLPDDLLEGLSELGRKHPNPDWVVALEKLKDLCGRQEHKAPADLSDIEFVAWVRSRVRGGVSGQDGKRSDGDKTEGADLVRLKTRARKHNRSFLKLPTARAAYAEAKRNLVKVTDRVSGPRDGEPLTVQGYISEIDQVHQNLIDRSNYFGPIAIIAEFDELDRSALEVVLERLVEISDSRQVLLFTERREAIRWVSDLGLALGSPVSDKTNSRI